MNSKAFIILCLCLASIVLAVPNPIGLAYFYQQIRVSVYQSSIRPRSDPTPDDDTLKAQFEEDIKGYATVSSTSSSSEHIVKATKPALLEFFRKNIGQNMLMKDFADDSGVQDILNTRGIYNIHLPYSVFNRQNFENNSATYSPAMIAFYFAEEGDILIRTEELNIRLTFQPEQLPYADGVHDEKEDKFDEVAEKARTYARILLEKQIIENCTELRKAARRRAKELASSSIPLEKQINEMFIKLDKAARDRLA